MLIHLFFYTLGGSLVLWLGHEFIPGVSFNGPLKILALAGFILGFLNAVLKPILEKITWPLRLLTLGLFNFVINMIILELVDIIFPELVITGLLPLFFTGLLLCLVTFLLNRKLP